MYPPKPDLASASGQIAPMHRPSAWSVSRGGGATARRDGAEIARGIVRYGAAEARAILGRKASEIAAILGYSRGDELIHRDDLVLS